MVPKSFQRYIECEYRQCEDFIRSQSCYLQGIDFFYSVYAKGKDDSDEWDNTFSEIIESSIDAGLKSEASYDDTMYDEEENYSETSNID